MDNQLDLAAIEDLIRQAMSAAKAQGIPIMDGSYGVCWREGCWIATQGICPQGAVLWAMNPPPDNVRRYSWEILEGERCATRSLAAYLGVSQYWVIDFAMGFDGRVRDDLHRYQEAFDLGRKFRQEWEQGLWGDHP